MNKRKNSTKILVESSIMVAFATVLSMLKLVDMPYGGSVTAASMLPIAIISYRHGISYGLISGVVYATIQQLLGLNTLSYVTGWQSVVAVIVLDYVIAFTLVGLAGVFKNKISFGHTSLPKKQSIELTVGMIFVCVLRYACHVIAGATVWAGLSIPTEAALVYSIGYNATYMIPETIVTACSCAWLGSVLDLSKPTPERFISVASENEQGRGACEFLPYFVTLIFVFVIALDTVLIAPCLQNADSGEFDFSGLSSAPWGIVAAVSIIGVALGVGLLAARTVIRKKACNKD